MLGTFGVDPSTEAVYRAVLESPAEDLVALGRRAGLSAEAVKGCLDDLVRHDLVSYGDDGRWLAVPPDQAIETLIAREHAALDERMREVEASRSSVTELVELYVANRSEVGDGGVVEHLDDAAVVRSRLFQLTQSVRESVWSLLPGEAFSEEATASSARLDLDLLGRGVDVRLVVSEVSLSTPHWTTYLSEISGAGAEVRVHAAPPYLAVVLDANAAVIPTSGSRGAIVLRGVDVVAPLRAFFEQVWRSAEPFEADRAPSTADQVTEARLRQVVALLAEGHKDETIARRLGVSSRTVRRFVAAAEEALHSHSRFQAGVEATRRGWVD